MIEKKPVRDGFIPVRRGTPAELDSRKSGVPVGTTTGIVPIAAVPADNLLTAMWRNRRLLLICLVVALAGGVIYVQTVTPIYASTAKLYLDYTGIRISNPYEPGSVPQTDKYLYTQAELIRSRPILGAAAEALAAQQLRTFASVDIPIAYLHKHMAIEIGKKDETIAISVRSPYPVEAAEIVNRIVETYMTSRSAQGQRNSAQVLKILQDEMLRTSKELEEKRNAVTDFLAKHMPLALGADREGGTIQRYLELQAACTQAHTRTVEAAAFRTAIQTLADRPLALRQYVRSRGTAGAGMDIDVEKSPLTVRAVDLEFQKANLLDSVTVDHPKVVGLTAELNQIEAKLAELDNQFCQAMRAVAEQQYIEAKSAEEETVRSFREQQQQLAQFSAESVQYQQLQSELETLRANYAQSRNDFQEFQKIAGEDVGRLRMAMLESAQPAPMPAEPQKGKILALALMVGLSLGAGTTVVRDWLDQTLRSTDEISALLHVPILGAVPAMSRRLRAPERGQRIFLQPDSHEAEAFRTIRTAVLFGTPKMDAKTMLVTSPVVGDGKSTLVSNLAIAIACAGQKTLVLDADFRRPTQHTIFELDCRQRCLSTVLTREMTLASAIQTTKIKGLHVLSCGHGISNPAEVLNSRLFARLLEHLAKAYDRIVIDAPPVMVVTDPQILGALCDTTVLVLRADKSTRKAAQRAINALESVGAHLLGVVVNDVPRAGERYGYYSGRYHRYRESDSDDGNGSKSRQDIAVGQKPGEVPARRVAQRT